MSGGQRVPLAVTLVAAAWVFAWPAPAGAISASVTENGEAAVHLGSARPGQETPVARLQFNPLSVPWPWELRMQPQSDALVGASGSVPLDRLQWSVGVGPGYGAGPRQPLTPGVTVVHRQEQPGYPLVVNWWFRPTWADRASSQPYRLGVTYTAYTATPDPNDPLGANPVNPAVLYPNPYDPAWGPLHVLARWGGLPDDERWSGRTVWLQVASLSGRKPPPCGDPSAGDVFVGPDELLPFSDLQAPPWVRHPWFEMTWDGRDRNGQVVGPGSYCVAVVMMVGTLGVYTVASGIVEVQPGAAQGSSLAVNAVNRRTGEALPGAWVRIGGPNGPAGREVRTGRDGRALFAGLPAGRYMVSARAPGYREDSAAVRLPGPRLAPTDAVTLALEPIEAPRLALRASPPEGDRASLGDLVRIELSAEAPAGTPTGAGEVVVELPDGLAGLPGTLRWSRPQDGARIEAGGRRVIWTVSALAARARAELGFVAAVTPAARGLRRLALAASGAFALAGPEGSRAGAGERVEAEPAVAELTLSDTPWRAASVVVGRVVDGQGEGIEGARIRAEDGTATRSGPQGWFTMALAPGPHLLAAYAAGPTGEAEGVEQGVHALVHVHRAAVHPIVLRLTDLPQPQRPDLALAAAGRAEWNGGAVQASGGVEASVHWGGTDARINLRAADGSVKVTGGKLVAAGHLLAIGVPEPEAAELLRRFYPAGQTGLTEGVASMRGPVNVWSWAGGRHPRVAAGVAIAQEEPGASPQAAASADTVRALVGARVDLAAGEWWARGRLLQANGPGEGPPGHLRWETGLTRFSGAYTLKIALAADQAGATGGSVSTAGQGWELRVATPGEKSGYGLGWRRAEGSLAGMSARTDLDPLRAVGEPVGTPARPAWMLDEVVLGAGQLGWGLRRLSGSGLELADTFAALTVLRAGRMAGSADQKAEKTAGQAQGRSQPQPLSIDALLGGPQAGMPASDGEGGLMQVRAGVVSAYAPGEEDEEASWWRPYLSGAASWPLGVGPALRRARVGGSLLWLPAVADPAGAKEASARGGAWADVAGEPVAGLEVALRARWEQEVRPGPAVGRSGLSLQAELHPEGPVRLGAGARSTASGLRWDQLSLAYHRQPVQVELRAGPEELRFTAAIEPPEPWRARLSSRWEAVAGGPVALREVQARGAYLGARWWATADLHRSTYARTIEAELGRSAPGWPGLVRTAAGHAAGPAAEGRGASPGVLSGAVPSVRLVWKRAWHEELDLDTVVIEPAVRLPLGARWGLLLEGASAFQRSAAVGWEARPAAWAGAGLYARTGGEAGALELEMGYRWVDPATPPAWAAPGLFVRVGSWAKGRWEHPLSPRADPRR